MPTSAHAALAASQPLPRTGLRPVRVDVGIDPYEPSTASPSTWPMGSRRTRSARVSSGVASDITLDDLAEGDMVAVTTDEDGVQTIIVLEVETAGDSSSSISSTDSTSTEESALEEAAGETDASAE